MVEPLSQQLSDLAKEAKDAAVAAQKEARDKITAATEKVNLTGSSGLAQPRRDTTGE